MTVTAKTISNATISNGDNVWAGLFGWITGNATESTEATTGIIMDLTPDNVDVTNDDTSSGSTKATQSASGVVAAAVYKGLVSNVSTTGTCSVSGAYRVGGIIGSANDVTKVTCCSNNATVSGTESTTGKYVGGIVGAAHDIDFGLLTLTGDPAIIEDCDNSGSVTGANEVGGIVGYTDQTTVEDCNNTGAVTSSSGNYGVGGIIGFDAYNPRRLYTPSKGASVTGCTNSGNISG